MSLITVKGYNDSLLFIFQPGSLPEYQNYIDELAAEKPLLFKGARILFDGPGWKQLTPEELASLQATCLKAGMLLQNAKPHTPIPAASTHTSLSSGGAANTVVRRTLRSGQKQHSEKDLIIWGNVNESAEITAGGDIIVLGRLEGLAHAGCYGNTESVIMAHELRPQQLRIADFISRAGEDGIGGNYPEIAYIEQGNICIKPYDPRDPRFR